jgi:hypothetical protein
MRLSLSRAALVSLLGLAALGAVLASGPALAVAADRTVLAEAFVGTW